MVGGCIAMVALDCDIRRMNGDGNGWDGMAWMCIA